MRPPEASERASWDLAPNAIVSACRSWQRSGRPLLDLTQSNPTVVGIEPPAGEILRALSQPGCLTYEPIPLGAPWVRERVARWYQQRGLPVRPERVVITASTSEAYAYVLKLLCNPGDTVAVPRPSYPLFDHLARLENVGLVHYPLIADDAWRIDVDALRAVVRPDTRAVFVVSPNNPTGTYLHADERHGIEELARERGLVIVCDEVFEEYVWRDRADRVRCAAVEAQVPTVSLGGLSKSAGMPQMKLGWMVWGGPEPSWSALRGRLEMIADTYLSVSAPVQHALPTLLDVAPVVRDQLRRRVRDNLGCLRTVLDDRTAVSAGKVDAGWYALLRVPAIMSDEAWAARLAERQGVVVHPGGYYGLDGDGTLVAGLIAPPDLFREGIRRLEGLVRELAE